MDEEDREVEAEVALEEEEEVVHQGGGDELKKEGDILTLAGHLYKAHYHWCMWRNIANSLVLEVKGLRM